MYIPLDSQFYEAEMKIAILVWGSLLWEQGDLKLATGWVLGGLALPLEFSRVSSTRDGALTLVIDPDNGAEIPTRFAESSLHNLEEAIYSLARREGTSRENIGYVDCRSGQSRSRLPPTASRGEWNEAVIRCKVAE